MCLSRCMAVEGLEIYDSPWVAVGFADNHHIIQVSGVPTGTFSSTPRRTSRSRCSLTVFSQ